MLSTVDGDIIALGDIMTYVKNPSPNLARLVSRYKGQWVALTQDEKRILGHGASIDRALEMASLAGEATPFLLKVPPKGVTAFFY